MLPAGTRVRLNDRVAWPERRGAEGVVVVDPNGPGVYPCDKPVANRVIVLLDNDPLTDRGPSGWTCAVTTDAVEVVS